MLTILNGIRENIVFLYWIGSNIYLFMHHIRWCILLKLSCFFFFSKVFFGCEPRFWCVIYSWKYQFYPCCCCCCSFLSTDEYCIHIESGYKLCNWKFYAVMNGNGIGLVNQHRMKQSFNHACGVWSTFIKMGETGEWWQFILLASIIILNICWNNHWIYRL